MIVDCEPRERLSSSFRDPAGFVFRSPQGEFLRQVNPSGRDDYALLIQSGLYDELVRDELLVEHEELPSAREGRGELILRPRQLPFLSYPYEWAFSALRSAALLTLDIQRRALRRGMCLKDASAFNVQMEGWRPIFIDTLSLTRHQPGRPWAGYAQFCRHFLAPLALMAKRDISLGRLLATHLDGIPLPLASRLLPAPTWLRPGLCMHLHLHAGLEAWYSVTRVARPAREARLRTVSSAGQEAIIDSLRSVVEAMSWRPGGTPWADYYETHLYAPDEFQLKGRLVAEFLDLVKPRTVWDLGANTGRFSRMASERAARTWSLDVDPGCVELAWQDARRRDDRNLLPLLVDLSNPPPAVGWAGRERASLAQRGPADLVLALALVHHLAIGHNVPFRSIFEFLSGIAGSVVIEFVPKSDPQVARLLRSREDIFDEYTEAGFEQSLAPWFAIARKTPVSQSGRVLYLLERRGTSQHFVI
jgi:hypothetical protein